MKAARRRSRRLRGQDGHRRTARSRRRRGWPPGRRHASGDVAGGDGCESRADADVARHVDPTRRARVASADAREGQATERMDLRATSERLEANRRRAHALAEAMRAGADEAAANHALPQHGCRRPAADRRRAALGPSSSPEAVGRLDASRPRLYRFRGQGRDACAAGSGRLPLCPSALAPICSAKRTGRRQERRDRVGV
jgi:hypothetical protein